MSSICSLADHPNICTVSTHYRIKEIMPSSNSTIILEMVVCGMQLNKCFYNNKVLQNVLFKLTVVPNLPSTKRSHLKSYNMLYHNRD